MHPQSVFYHLLVFGAVSVHFLRGTINPCLLPAYHIVILTLLEGSHNIWHPPITSLLQESTPKIYMYI